MGIKTKKLVELCNHITSIIKGCLSSLLLLENILFLLMWKTVAISLLELRHGTLQDISDYTLLLIIKSWVLQRFVEKHATISCDARRWTNSLRLGTTLSVKSFKRWLISDISWLLNHTQRYLLFHQIFTSTHFAVVVDRIAVWFTYWSWELRVPIKFILHRNIQLFLRHF